MEDGIRPWGLPTLGFTRCCASTTTSGPPVPFDATSEFNRSGESTRSLCRFRRSEWACAGQGHLNRQRACYAPGTERPASEEAVGLAARARVGANPGLARVDRIVRRRFHTRSRAGRRSGLFETPKDPKVRRLRASCRRTSHPPHRSETAARVSLARSPPKRRASVPCGPKSTRRSRDPSGPNQSGQRPPKRANP